MALKDRINELQEELIPQVPDDALEKLQSMTQDLIQAGISDSAVGPGDPAPAIDLPYSSGNGTSDRWSLQEALQDGPVVLSFYRGGW